MAPNFDHTGLAAAVTPSAEAWYVANNHHPHDSSHQHGVANNDFATYFHGRGTFYR